VAQPLTVWDQEEAEFSKVYTENWPHSLIFHVKPELNEYFFDLLYLRRKELSYLKPGMIVHRPPWVRNREPPRDGILLYTYAPMHVFAKKIYNHNVEDKISVNRYLVI
jgi:hypothetical protein